MARGKLLLIFLSMYVKACILPAHRIMSLVPDTIFILRRTFRPQADVHLTIAAGDVEILLWKNGRESTARTARAAVE